eukprot:8117098-Prorocentrum_lima.AAC.1
MELFVVPSVPTQMVSTFYNLEHPVHLWTYDQSRFTTSHDQEAGDETTKYGALAQQLPLRSARI